MATNTELQSRSWGYQIKGEKILLYKIDTVSWEYVAPDVDITDGLKIEGITGSKVFVDSSGDDDNTSPTEASYLNCSDSVAQAVVLFVKARLYEHYEKFEQAEYFRARFDSKLSEAMGAKIPQPRLAKTSYPYAIR